MFRRSTNRCTWASAVATLILTSGWALADQAPTAAVRKHVSPDGVSNQAVLIKSQGDLGESSHEHVILVDTSASQVGEHRLHAQRVVEGLLSGLPREDRVRLFAIDVQAEPLTADFGPR
ncbi:MAG: hypothetical protein U0872_05880 [Planctomycetaceae bacterium]